MDKEFLDDYEAKERQEIECFIKSISEGKFSKTQIFPTENRFKKLHNPITYRGSMGVGLWSLVPFSGSTIIPLLAAEKKIFENLHKFSINQIEEMVTFAEDTGKIQFVLLNEPTAYSWTRFFGSNL
jgi:hypothetical protein